MITFLGKNSFGMEVRNQDVVRSISKRKTKLDYKIYTDRLYDFNCVSFDSDIYNKQFDYLSRFMRKNNFHIDLNHSGDPDHRVIYIYLRNGRQTPSFAAKLLVTVICVFENWVDFMGNRDYLIPIKVVKKLELRNPV